MDFSLTPRSAQGSARIFGFIFATKSKGGYKETETDLYFFISKRVFKID
jgi:hypothetical protein